MKQPVECLMEINRDILLMVAKNARIKLSESEIKELLPQLEEVLSYFSALNSINTGYTEPAFQPIDIKNILREDNVKKCLNQEDVFRDVKNKKDGFFKGPRVI